MLPYAMVILVLVSAPARPAGGGSVRRPPWASPTCAANAATESGGRRGRTQARYAILSRRRSARHGRREQVLLLELRIAIGPCKRETDDRPRQTGHEDIARPGGMDGMTIGIHGRQDLARGRVEAHQATAQRILCDELEGVPIGHHPQAAIGAEVDALGGAKVVPAALQPAIGVEHPDAVVGAVADVQRAVRPEDHRVRGVERRAARCRECRSCPPVGRRGGSGRPGSCRSRPIRRCRPRARTRHPSACRSTGRRCPPRRSCPATASGSRRAPSV